MAENILKEEKGYFGEYISEWKKEYKNKYIITGHQQEDSNVYTRVGKLVQIRLEAGCFGSDTVLIRHVNNDLATHENQSFWLIPEKYYSYLDEKFKDVYEDDADEIEYSIGAKHKRKGFIIPSEIGENETTPMRSIKLKIESQISNILDNG